MDKVLGAATNCIYKMSQRAVQTPIRAWFVTEICLNLSENLKILNKKILRNQDFSFQTTPQPQI